MYEQHFGLTTKPFSLLPDPDVLYLSSRHRRALGLLEYGITSQAAFTVITGEIGSGKTTLLQYFLRTLGPESTIGLITNVHSSFGDPMGWVTQSFDIPVTANDPATLYNAFVEFVIQQYAAGKRTILAIDEAQNFSLDMLEKLRMLSNINSGKELLLHTILVGQPELLTALNRPELHQFAQRIAASYHLDPLDAADTAGYIDHRLTNAGGSGDLFTAEARTGVYFFSHGVPRLINSLCDMALVYGYAEDLRRIDLSTVLDVVRDREASGLSAFRRMPAGEDQTVTNQILNRRAGMSPGLDAAGEGV
ncbi:MAG TPA: AAA family ATPase [Azospirillaceae bacterium]|nr:AAA family ATPase [Azospirillaceae bacterium]